MAAWRNLSDEMVSVLGRLITVAKATAIGTAIVAGLVFFFGREAATGWLIAAAAGSLAWPLTSVRVGRAGVAGQQRRHDDTPTPTVDDRAIDDILAKISRQGLDALTPAERKRLEAARRSKLRRPR
jgi:hypothetical protein